MRYLVTLRVLGLLLIAALTTIAKATEFREQPSVSQYNVISLHAEKSFIENNPSKVDKINPEFITRYMSQIVVKKELDLKKIIEDGFQFEPVNKNVLNYGFTTNYYWLKFTIRNQSNKTGNWVLSTGLRSPALLDVYENTNGKYQKILRHRSTNNYEDKPFNHRYLFVNLELSANQEKTIYIHLKNSVGLRMVPRILSSSRFQEEWREDYFFIGVFLSCLMTLIIVNLAQYVATLKPIYFLYSNLVFWSALSVTQHSGLNSKFLWPDHPELDSIATTLISVPSAVLLLQVMRTAMDLSKFSPVVDRVVLFFMSFWVLSIPMMLIFDALEILSILVLSVPPTGLILLTTISIVSIKNRIQSAAFYIFAWSCFYIGVSIFNLMHSGMDILSNNEGTIYIYGTSVVIEGIALFLALAHQTRILHISNAKNRRQTIDLLRDRVVDLELIGKLDVERQQAQEENREKSLKLASTSHDIFQPLYAIRTFLSDLKAGKSSFSPGQVIEEIEIVEEMLRSTILESKEEIGRSIEHVSINRLFNQLLSQNYKQAKKNNVHLKFVPTSLYIPGSKIIVLRILDNLIKNALRVSAQGKVICGVRRRNEGIELQVLDTGPGLKSCEFKKLVKPFNQGVDSDKGNHGLGLSIISTLCKQQNYTFSIESKCGIGSKFSIAVPC